MKFIADTMLGTLARWLRILGFDTVYARDMGDDEIIQLAKLEDRIIISRDRELCGRVLGSILLSQDTLRNQIITVLGLHPPEQRSILTRCLECNSVLQTADKISVAEEVPEAVFSKLNEFWKCPGCKKVYWKGSHYDKMRDEANKIIAQCES
ncbi:MAG: Mut7-C RNAse domain-containing protein [Candidatus Thermoplasmatota archaeon]|nr:hypothetical protein [Euryarchaeota archaeon]MBU4032652.1 Mut7-C RNAse domain-containing protein [Candidatus Thermoplasmatota archaeon]MBU4143982.1 Mut7-C RNAse domain-containing protein [Candidatus Thermoplasmatota archaeon]MBU4592044.1 Mut7-C RNAse domain-containing protein [Candidatus Thermoplasmatota archaeon]